MYLCVCMCTVFSIITSSSIISIIQASFSFVVAAAVESSQVSVSIICAVYLIDFFLNPILNRSRSENVHILYSSSFDFVAPVFWDIASYMADSQPELAAKCAESTLRTTIPENKTNESEKKKLPAI